MAAIFQIRRGTSNETLLDGELYLHKTSGSIQFGSGSSNVITLLPLNAPAYGNINLQGSISASGDVRIGGNIYLGDGSGTDNISALGQFNTNLIPNGTIDIGTTSAPWTNVYANRISASFFTGSFSGSINGVEFTSFSSSIVSRVNQLSTDSGSQNTRITDLESKATTLQTYTASVSGHIVDINTKTGSFETKFSTLQTYTTSVNSRLNDVENYTSSLRTAIDVTGGNTRILGNLIVDGTQTSLNTTNVYIEDFKITLSSGSTNSAAADGSGFEIAGANVSMSWEHSNNRFGINTNLGVLGAISSSTITGLNNVSVSTYSTSVDSRLTNLQLKSSSVDISISNINAYTASNDTLNNLQTTRINQLAESTASVNSFSASATASIVELFSTASNHEVRIDDLETKATTLQSYTASVEDRFTTISNVTSSLNLHTASLNLFTSSTYSNFSTSVDLRLDQLEYTSALLTPQGQAEAFNAINTFTGSANNRLNNLEATSASLNAFSSSINTTIKTKLNTDGVVSGSSQITISSTTGYSTFSSSLDSRFGIIETYTASNDTTNTLQTTRINQLAAATASVNLFTQSVNEHISDINNYTASLKTAISVTGNNVVVSGDLTVLGDAVTLNVGNLTVEDKTIVIASGSISSAVADGAGLYISGANASILWNHSNSRLDINKSIDVLGDITLLGTIDGIDLNGHFTDINTKTGSFETKFSTLGTYTSSLNGHIVDINSYTSSTNSRLNNIESFTSSIDTTIKTKLDTDGVISGSSQVSYVSLSNIPSGIISSSAQIDTLFNIDGIVSGSSQITLSSTTGGGTTANVQFGSLGIGTTASGVSGEIRATGDIVAFYSSDERLKENITPIENAIDKINQMGGYNYDWKEGFETIHSHKGHDLGVIAQEVQSVLPEVVTERETGYLAVDYVKLVPVLIEAIKELSAKIDRLENK